MDMTNIIPLLSAWRSDREPETTDTTLINGICGESVGVWAYAGRVVLECDDGRVLTDSHMSVDAARALHAALEQTIADAERIAGTVQIGGGRDRTFRVGGGVPLREFE